MKYNYSVNSSVINASSTEVVSLLFIFLLYCNPKTLFLYYLIYIKHPINDTIKIITNKIFSPFFSDFLIKPISIIFD